MRRRIDATDPSSVQLPLLLGSINSGTLLCCRWLAPKFGWNSDLCSLADCLWVPFHDCMANEEYVVRYKILSNIVPVLADDLVYYDYKYGMIVEDTIYCNMLYSMEM